MTIIYGIKNCNTMKKAFTALDQLGIPYQFHDYKKAGIDEATLQRWLSQVGSDVLLNKKGTTWKKLDEQQQAYTLSGQAQLIEMLIAHPSMIKRPVLETAQGLIIGFDEQQYQQLKNNH